jgi:hypothetical protein
MYMPKKIRKQIYIDPGQEKLLKRSAKRTGLSEAEIIRKALDVGIGAIVSISPRADIWVSELAYINRLMKKGPARGGRNWNRDDLHER